MNLGNKPSSISEFESPNFMSTASGRIIITQPVSNVWEYESEWRNGMYKCCSNPKLCFCAFVCPLCFLCELFSSTGECLCTPIFVPFALMALRMKLRTGFRIKGTMAKDCLAVTFCTPCAAIQMFNELKDQGL